MAQPPNARAKRGNASRYCCGSGHAHRQGGSPLKAKINAARHRSASAAIAVRMDGSDMILKALRFNLSSFRVPRTHSSRANDRWRTLSATRSQSRSPPTQPGNGFWQARRRNRKRSVCRYAHSTTVGSLFAGQRAVTLINAFWCEFLAAMPAFPFGSAPGTKLFGSFSLECTPAFR